MSIITIKDIAEKLKLSISTVSRALNDHPSISKETKGRVVKAAKGMSYHPNTIARNLKTQQTRTIGVLVPGIHYYFFSQVISGIEDIAFQSGYSVMVYQSNEDYDREVFNIKSMLSHRIAGLLISVSQNTKEVSHLKEVLNHNVPLVLFDRDIKGFEVCKVLTDDFDGAFKITEHLINKGYKKIAHITGPEDLSICENRLEGYKKALKKHNIPFLKEYVVSGGLDEDAGIEGCKKLLKLKDRPDAIMCVNDPVAVGVYSHMEKLKLNIPKDIAVTGFSNIPLSHMIRPALTTLDQPAYKMGTEAAEILIKNIENNNCKSTPEKIILKTRLIVRDST